MLVLYIHGKKNNTNKPKNVVLYLWCLNINYVNWVVLYLWSLNINYVDEFSLYLWRWNVVKIHTGKLWVFQETLLLGSNTLINFFSIFQETLLLGRHFHSGLQSSMIIILLHTFTNVCFGVYIVNFLSSLMID